MDRRRATLLPAGRAQIVLGFLLLLMAGVPYAYSLLKPALTREFSLSEVASALPFSAILVSYTVGMLVGGGLSDRYGPRKVGMIGAVLFGGGFFLAGLSPSFAVLLVTYGLLCGFGIGLEYMAAVTAAVRHHPTHRGMATGFVVLGFGLSSALLSAVVHALLESSGWRGTMMTLGAVFLVLSLPLTARLSFPEASPAAPVDAEEKVRIGPRFLTAWLAWALALSVGLGWLGQLADLARDRGFSSDLVPWLVSLVALSNGFARPLVGTLSDLWPRFRVLTLGSLLACAVVCLPLAVSSPSILWPVGLGIGICFGGWLVNMAPVSAEAFGGKGLGRTYGLLFTSYGVGALVGPPMIAYLRTLRADDAYGLAASAALLLVAAGLFARAGTLRAPESVLD